MRITQTAKKSPADNPNSQPEKPAATDINNRSEQQAGLPRRSKNWEVVSDLPETLPVTVCELSVIVQYAADLLDELMGS